MNQGKIWIGITTDDNLETCTQNDSGREQLQIIRHDLPYKLTDQPNQIIGIAISYTATSITTRMLFSNDEPIPAIYTPLPPDWSEELRNNSPYASLDDHR